MFFRSSDFSVKLLTVMELRWGHVQARVDPRPFHALSFRMDWSALTAEDWAALAGAETTGTVISKPLNFTVTVNVAQVD